MLVERIVENLDQEMRVKISQSNPTRAIEVKAYRFQDSPIEKNIYLAVSSGNPKDPEYRDGRVNTRDMENVGMNIPAGEIGGGHYWWRRGRVTLGTYFVTKNYAQNVAANYAHIVRGRAEYYTEQTNVADLVDEFGERAYYLMVIASNFFEGGGPEGQYLWRGEIIWQALTHRPI
jgi:hypothetical protein